MQWVYRLSSTAWGTWGIIAAVMLAVGGLTCGAAAQQGGDETSPGEALAQHRLTAAARALLQRADRLEAPHAAAAEQVLAMAVELDPTDAHGWSLRLEAAELAGDTETRRQALRQYLGQARRDDAAQWRLIKLLADREDNVTDRLGVYERLLDGDRADQLSAPLRSRVAMRAAELHREQGRTGDYVERLKQALRLDEANPAAAAEALFFIERRGGDRVEVIQTLLTLLAADPGNSATHERIAQRLLACGNYGPAATWYDAVSRLWEVEGTPGAEQVTNIVFEWALALWGADEPGEALGLIDMLGDALAVEDPADLPVDVQTLRVAILQAAGEQEDAAAAFDALAAELEARRPEDDEQNPAPLADLAWAHLLLGYEEERAVELTQTLETLLPLEDAMLRRLRIWSAARSGDAERARELFEQAESPTPAERLGLVVAEEGAPREQRAAVLEEVFAEASDALVGVWAADRLRELGMRPQPTGDCATIGRLVQGVPRPLREGAAIPSALIELAADPESRRVDYGEPIEIDVTLRNHAEVPLSLGETGAVSGRVMLVVRARVGDEEEARSLSPQFVEMGRSLRLEPGEQVAMRVRLDEPELVRLLDEYPTQAVRLDVQAVLHPRLTDDGRFLPGVFGDAVELPTLVRTRVELSEDSVEALSGRLEGEDRTMALHAAARLVGLAHEAEAAGQDEVHEQSVAAVEAFYADAEPAERAFVVSHLLAYPDREDSDDEPAAVTSAGFEPLLERARMDEATVVQAMLLSAGAEPDPVALEMALAQQDGPIRTLAERLAAIEEDTGAEP